MWPRIDVDDPRRGDVVALLQRHLDWAALHSPPEDVHALDLTGLLHPSITFLSARDDDGVLLGVGALKELDPTHAEIKSMHTAVELRGRGVGRSLLACLLDVARDRHYDRVSLETGSMEAFAPARAMYVAAGFVESEPFGDYDPSRYSTFMTLPLVVS